MTSNGNGSARWVNRCATGSAQRTPKSREAVERGRVQARHGAHAVGEREQRQEGDRAPGGREQGQSGAGTHP